MEQLTEDQARRQTANREEDLNAFTDAVLRWTNVKARAEPIYQRGKQTREQLTAAAKTAFIRIGYIDCSVEDILQEADISRGTFYAHFSSKKAIFGAVVTEHIKERISRTEVTDAGGSDYPDRVRLTIERFLMNYSSTQDLSLVIEQAANYDPEFRKVRMVIRDIFARRIERGIRRQQKAGRISDGLDARLHALMILSMLTNMAQVEIGWRGSRPSKQLIDSMTNFWCNGLDFS